MLDLFLQETASEKMASEAKDENPEHINLKVMGQEGNVVQSKMMRHAGQQELHGRGWGSCGHIKQGREQGGFCLLFLLALHNMFSAVYNPFSMHPI